MPFLRQFAQLTHIGRSCDRIKCHLHLTGCDQSEEYKRILNIDEFIKSENEFDAIVNCIGFGTPEKVAAAGLAIYRLTDSIDEVCLNKLEKFPNTTYVNFSSGAVYGTSHDDFIGNDPVFIMHLNKPDTTDHYRLAKLHCERKHRAWGSASIVDLRLFNFFSEYINPDSNYLACEILRCIRNGQVMNTNPVNIVRDFVHPSDLATLVFMAANSKGINIAVDVYSRESVRKFTLLDAIKRKWNFHYAVTDNLSQSPTGQKEFYASGNKTTEQIWGYKPVWSSLESICDSIHKHLRAFP